MNKYANIYQESMKKGEERCLQMKIKRGNNVMVRNMKICKYFLAVLSLLQYWLVKALSY